tara:strand:- start:221 stop:481 length:261 start_codon:yes stop_codon:yes gene_type:complete
MAKKTKIRKASPTYEYKTIGKRRSKEKGLSAVAKCQKKGGKWSKGKCVTPAKKVLKAGATAAINTLTLGMYEYGKQIHKKVSAKKN